MVRSGANTPWGNKEATFSFFGHHLFLRHVLAICDQCSRMLVELLLLLLLGLVELLSDTIQKALIAVS